MCATIETPQMLNLQKDLQDTKLTFKENGCAKSTLTHP